MVRDDVAGLFEPKLRKRSEHAAFVGDLVGKDDVEDADAVARDHQQRVEIDLVELANLARIHVR